MYLDFYGLTEKPFSLTPDPKYFFASGSHAEARDLIRYGVREREGFLCVTGAIGTGKTTVLRTVLEGFGRDVVTALVLNPFLSEEDLLRIILVDFGIATREELNGKAGRRYSKQDLIDRLNDHLLTLSAQGRAAVLVVDEAQNLPLPVLEQVRLLSNLETAKEKLLQIVLSGQLGLRDLLASPKLRQLNQRISIRYRIQPLTVQEVGRYIEHRLRIAGSQGDIVFTDGALERVHRYSQGVPRLVNLIADRALLAGYAARTKRIDPEMIDRAAETLDLNRPGAAAPVEPDPDEPRKQKAGWFRRVLLGTSSCLILAVGGYLAFGGMVDLPEVSLGNLWASSSAVAAEGAPNGATADRTADRTPARRPGAEGAPAARTPERNGSGSHAGKADASAPVDPGRAGGEERPSSERSSSVPSGDYTIYLSSYPDPQDPELDGLRWKLARAGYPTYLVEAEPGDQGTLYRLVVGDYPDPRSASLAAHTLRDDLDVAHARAVSVAEVLGS